MPAVVLTSLAGEGWWGSRRRVGGGDFQGDRLKCGLARPAIAEHCSEFLKRCGTSLGQVQVFRFFVFFSQSPVLCVPSRRSAGLFDGSSL